MPWLILTDRNHVVTAEGFGIDELDTRLAVAGSSTNAVMDSQRVIVTVTDDRGNVLAHVRVTESETAEQYTTDDRGQFACRPRDQTQCFFAVDK
ncbi:MAG: hypothetical protein ABSD56_09055, partial [Bryobacteraceae bacterium]